MRTQFWSVPIGAFNQNHPNIQEAAKLIQLGKRVAFPTETVYGLGADARSTEAVDGIFAAKGRPSDNPLIVHIANPFQLNDLVDRPDETCLRLMERFWPGPLTLVLPLRADSQISPRVTAGLDTVGVRIPDHPVALSLLAAAACPIAAPSANRSGRPSPTTASHVRDDLDGRIEGILDGGPTGVGLESTVVQVQHGIVHILRPGGITKEQLIDAGFLVQEFESTNQPAESKDKEWTPRAPGMKYAHYAPKGRMTIVEGENHTLIRERIQQELNNPANASLRTGVLTFVDHATFYQADVIEVCGHRDRPDQLAQQLFSALRRFDEAGVDIIFAEGCPNVGIGHAVMNRLRKAAGHHVIEV